MDLTDVRDALRNRFRRDTGGVTVRPEDRDAIAARLRHMLDEMRKDGVRLAPDAAERVIEQVLHDVAGLGPLQPLLDDPAVTEIMVNGPDRIFVERDGGRFLAAERFDGERHLRLTIDRLVRESGKRLDENAPYVDLTMADGSRVNVVIPPVVAGGPHLTIRKYVRSIRNLADLRARGAIDDRLLVFLDACVRARMTLLLAGATGSGKTTLLEAMATHFGADERIVLIEDTPELRLEQQNVVRMLTRAPNIEGKGEVTIRELFRNCLRMRPTRILLGEIRGKEALDYLQAITSGHRGSLAVLHASSPEEACIRLENLVLQSGINVPVGAIRTQIAHGIDYVLQLAQLQDGTRRLTRLAEVSGLGAGEALVLQDVFRFEEEGLRDGKVEGRFVATGVVPRMMARFRLAGAAVTEEMFRAG